MALLNEAIDEKNQDIRMIDRKLARGVLSQDEVDQLAKKLPDDGGNADWVSIEELRAQDENSPRKPTH